MGPRPTQEALRYPVGHRSRAHQVHVHKAPVRLPERSPSLSAHRRHADRGWVRSPRLDGRSAKSATSPACALFETYDTYYRATGRSTAGSGRSGISGPTPYGQRDSPRRRGGFCRSCRAWSTTTRSPRSHGPRDSFTAQCTQTAYLWPARHEAGQDDANCPPMARASG